MPRILYPATASAGTLSTYTSAKAPGPRHMPLLAHCLSKERKYKHLDLTEAVFVAAVLAHHFACGRHQLCSMIAMPAGSILSARLRLVDGIMHRAVMTIMQLPRFFDGDGYMCERYLHALKLRLEGSSEMILRQIQVVRHPLGITARVLC